MPVRVNKQKARRLYNQAKTVTLIPCNVPLQNAWIAGYRINIVLCEDREFDKIVNEFSFYNCNNILGKYPAYYVEEENAL